MVVTLEGDRRRGDEEDKSYGMLRGVEGRRREWEEAANMKREIDTEIKKGSEAGTIDEVNRVTGKREDKKCSAALDE